MSEEKDVSHRFPDEMTHQKILGCFIAISELSENCRMIDCCFIDFIGLEIYKLRSRDLENPRFPEESNGSHGSLLVGS